MFSPSFFVLWSFDDHLLSVLLCFDPLTFRLSCLFLFTLYSVSPIVTCSYLFRLPHSFLFSLPSSPLPSCTQSPIRVSLPPSPSPFPSLSAFTSTALTLTPILPFLPLPFSLHCTYPRASQGQYLPWGPFLTSTGVRTTSGRIF